jgi:hypothetical protein
MTQQRKPANPAEAKLNRVWIELERPRKLPRGQVNDQGGSSDLTHAGLIYERANNMLQRLMPGTPYKFWWSARHACYALTTSEAGTFIVLSDNGHWFDLDYIGRPIEEAAS